jgi:hypothetical protein
MRLYSPGHPEPPAKDLCPGKAGRGQRGLTSFVLNRGEKGRRNPVHSLTKGLTPLHINHEAMSFCSARRHCAVDSVDKFVNQDDNQTGICSPSSLPMPFFIFNI